MTFEAIASALDWLGILAFVITGCIVASRQKMDVVGFIVLGTVTGIGGGTLRDLLLGHLPVFWVREPAYLLVCVVVSAAMFFSPTIPPNRYRFLLWIDALGLALFSVTGAERALMASASPAVAVTMGIITACFGGIIRDVFANRMPVVLVYEVYILASFAGATTFAILSSFGFSREWALVGGVAIGFSLRSVAILLNLSLPRYARNEE
jgi:uncharacterized membrane protein YeiH